MSSLLLAALAGLPASSAGAARIGIVPDPDPDRQAESIRAARLAVAAGDPELDLVVGRGSGHWDGVTAVVAELLDEEQVDLLLVPPDRAVTHLVAQVATRRHVPAIALASRESAVGASALAAGSWWLVVCVPPAVPPEGLAQGLGRPPTEVETAAWSAVEVARRLLSDDEGWFGGRGASWRDRLPPSCLSPTPTSEGPP